jgi:hypothetical protein
MTSIVMMSMELAVGEAERNTLKVCDIEFGKLKKYKY